MQGSSSPPLSITHPELARQAHGWDPTTVTFGSPKRREWIDELGHIWSALVVQRTNRLHPTGCPVCNGKVVLAGFNDLASINPELAKQAHGWDPTTVTWGSGKRREWRCDEGHNWSASVCSRSHGNGCPYCTRLIADPGKTDLATENPQLAREAHGWDPTTVLPGSNKRREWMCTKGHIWVAMVSERSRGTGCPVCYDIRHRHLDEC